MPTAWLLSPYELVASWKPKPVRSPVIARRIFLGDLQSSGGQCRWLEVEGDQAVCRVRGTTKQVSDLRTVFQELSESEAFSAWSPTCSTARYNPALDKIEFDLGKQAAVQPLSYLVGKVPEVRQSTDLMGLTALWMGVGFGHGWRVPQGVCEWMACHDVLPGSVWEQVARVLFDQRGVFPTTSVLDTFNRANENPLSQSGAWSGPVLTGDQDLRVASNVCAGQTTGTFNSAYRVGASFGPNSEAFGTLSTTSTTDGDYLSFYLRLTNPETTTPTAYWMTVLVNTGANNDERQYQKVISGTYTVLSNDLDTVDHASDDTFGFEATGAIPTTLQSYKKPSGGSWAAWLDNDTSNSEIDGAGAIGTEIKATIPRLNDFGGGTVGAPSVTALNLRPSIFFNAIRRRGSIS